jgi:hypothetical protein
MLSICANRSAPRTPQEFIVFEAPGPPRPVMTELEGLQINIQHYWFFQQGMFSWRVAVADGQFIAGAAVSASKGGDLCP